MVAIMTQKSVLEVRRVPIYHPRGGSPRGVVWECSVGAARRDVLIREAHEVLGLAPEFGEPLRGLILRDVVALVELGLQPCEEAHLSLQ
jgi:hypothetical protein